MKPHACCAALLTLLASVVAHADDAEPVVAHASFATTATLDVVTHEACGLRPLLTTSTTRPVAVTVGDRACSSNGQATGVTLVVRVLQGNGGGVELDAAAPGDVSQVGLQALVDENARVLKMRLAADQDRASSPFEPEHRSPLFAAGIVTTVVGGAMEVVGLGLEVVSLFKGFQLFGGWCSSCEDHVGEMVASGLLVGSLVTIVVGTQLIRIGKEPKKSSKHPNVSAGISPTGGSLRVTF